MIHPQRNNVLETLMLNYNDFEESGAKHLMLALGSNTALKYLGIQVRPLTIEHKRQTV